MITRDLAGVRLRVVGSGVSGLAAAVIAGERGANVEIVEATRAVGGLLAPFEFRGIACDAGSHRLHRVGLSHPTVARLVAPTEPIRRRRRGVLLLRGRRISYPPSWLGLAWGLGGDGVRFGIDLARRPNVLRDWESMRGHDEDRGFAEFVRARVGDAAYQAFYRPYAEKVWGLDANEISQTVAKARVSSSSPWQLVGRMMRSFSGERRVDEFFYPKGGMSSVVQHLRSRANALGVRLVQSTRIDRREVLGEFDAVLFSGALRDLIDPNEGSSLDHRGLYLIYLALPIDRLGPFETYYTPETHLWFGRVSELQNYSSTLRRAGETTICVEIPEGKWGREHRFDRGQELDEILRQLRASGIVPRGVAPIAVEQRFVEDVYPMYRRGWVASWSTALERVARLRNVLPFGRQGLFLHCNVDQCIAMADDVVSHVAARREFSDWHAHARRLLGLRVRD